MTGQSSDGSLSRRSATANGQIVASKALGVPVVYVEAVDQDGNRVVEKVESEIALLWPFVHKEVVIGKHGKEEDDPVQLPKQVGQDILALLLEYCRYHRYPGRSDKERKVFDEKFIRLDTRRLCELTSAADSLDMRPLVDLSSRALARMIEGKSPDEIRETFHLPDDLTEEEKLEPVKNVADDPRIRLLNRLYAKKRKELAEKKAELHRREAGVKSAAHPNKETRTVEELLSFIQEERQGQAKKQGKKKRAKKKKEASREHSLDTERSSESKLSGQGTSMLSSPGPNSPRSLNRGESLSQDGMAWPEVDNLDDAELDDEIEAFERSLRADWEDRRAELILMAGAFPSRPSRGAGLAGLHPLKTLAPEPQAPKNGKRLPDADNQADPTRTHQLGAAETSTSDAGQSANATLSASTSAPITSDTRQNSNGGASCPPESVGSLAGTNGGQHLKFNHPQPLSSQEGRDLVRDDHEDLSQPALQSLDSQPLAVAKTRQPLPGNGVASLRSASPPGQGPPQESLRPAWEKASDPSPDGKAGCLRSDWQILSSNGGDVVLANEASATTEARGIDTLACEASEDVHEVFPLRAGTQEGVSLSDEQYAHRPRAAEEGAETSGDAAAGPAILLAELMKDFVEQLGLHDVISIQVKDCRSDSKGLQISKAVVMQSNISNIGLVKLQRSITTSAQE